MHETLDSLDLLIAPIAQVIAINELLALGFANLGGALYGAVPTQILGNRTYRVGILVFGDMVLGS